jgi:thiamine biosynthesis protein ThiS
VITVTVNGIQRPLEGPTKLNTFLKDLGAHSAFMAIAHNGEVLDKSGYWRVTLQDGDSLELVRPVGGGMAIKGTG